MLEFWTAPPASRYTTTKRLREAFSEFDGAQIAVKFDKAWGSLCDYAIKEDEQPLTWGKKASPK